MTYNLLSKFSTFVDATPDKVAIVDSSGKEYSYKELDHYSDQIATKMFCLKLPDNKRIGINLSRSYEAIAVMLAALKLGCTYVPIASDLPQNRVHDIFSRAKLQYAVSNEATLYKIPRIESLLNIDKERDVIQSIQDIQYERDLQQTQAANIIFTSGTVSMPKGVAISQQGLLNLVSNQNYVNITNKDVLIHLSSFEFDGSTLEIWGTLLNGAKLIVIPQGYPVLSILAEKIEIYGVSLAFITTQLFNLLVDNRLSSLDKIERILTGGERASVRHMRTFVEARCHNRFLANIYGPAECTTFSTFYPIMDLQQISQSDNIPIGKSINGAYTIIVDEFLNPVPKNTMGELLIGGIGVSQGYLEAPEVTAEKFIHRQFDSIPTSYFYRTGDKVFENDDGDIVFVGRYDRSIKVRGYRILPEEIETIAMQYPNISSAALIVFETSVTSKYVQLFITETSKDFSLEKFKKFLKNELPGYVQVNRISVLTEMPLKQVGKIDYDKLKYLALETLN